MLPVFMRIGMPVALGLCALLTILFLGQDSHASLALKLCETSGHLTLLAIACVGHLRGGQAIGSVLACMLFAVPSGSPPATVCAFFRTVFVHRDIRFAQAPHVPVDAAKVTLRLMFIIANALLLAHVLTSERIPEVIAGQIIAWGMPPRGVNSP